MNVTQSFWRWKIASYFFGAGMASGCYVIGVMFDFMEFVSLAKMAILISFPILIISALFLIWDLGRPERLLLLQPLGHIFSNWKKAWISRGAATVSVFMVLIMINIALWIWPFRILETALKVRLSLEVVGLALAIFTMVYSGIDLGVMKARPAWNNSILPLLFTCSALLTGIGVLFVSICLSGNILGDLKGFMASKAMKTLYFSGMALIVLEALSIYFYLIIGSTKFREKVNLLIRGELKGLFWGGHITIGLIIPFILLLIIYTYQMEELMFIFVVGHFLLIGGLLLRALIIFSGTRTSINVKGVPFYIRPEV